MVLMIGRFRGLGVDMGEGEGGRGRGKRGSYWMVWESGVLV